MARRSDRDDRSRADRDKYAPVDHPAPPDPDLARYERERERAADDARRGGSKRSSQHEQAVRDREKEQKLVHDMMGYSNASNPFNDKNLSQPFVWKLKEKEAQKQGLVQSSGKTMAERLQEIERLKEQREKREKEKEELSNMRDRMIRAQLGAEVAEEWDSFELDQHKRRATTRITEGRHTHLDALWYNMRTQADASKVYELMTAGLAKEGESIETAVLQPRLEKLGPGGIRVEDAMTLIPDGLEPYLIFCEQDVQALLDIKADLAVFARVDYQAEFWSVLSAHCDRKIAEARANGGVSGSSGVSVRSAVADEIEEVIKSATSYAELQELDQSIHDSLESGEAKDTEYWETLLERIGEEKEKALLRELYRRAIDPKLELIEDPKDQEAMLSRFRIGTERLRNEARQRKDEREQGVREAKQALDRLMRPQRETRIYSAHMPRDPSFGNVRELQEDDYASDDAEAIPDAESLRAAEQALEAQRDLESKAAALSYKSAQLAVAAVDGVVQTGAYVDDDQLMVEERRRAAEEGEEQYNEAVPLPPGPTPRDHWEAQQMMDATSQRSHLRKPRYFNRVRLGYEWNKYNQTHFDSDNPPPRTVQGYKFNIFYPDLADKTKTPTYSLVRDGPDTLLLRFHAGAPYEDVAFRILDKPWERSSKHGFRCTFERGVLHLWVNLQRHRYRK